MSVQLVKMFERARKRVAGELPVPVLGGPSHGSLTIGNSAGLIARKVLGVLRSGDAGAVGLEPDEFVDGAWTNTPDAYIVCSIDLCQRDCPTNA